MSYTVITQREIETQSSRTKCVMTHLEDEDEWNPLVVIMVHNIFPGNIGSNARSRYVCTHRLVVMPGEGKGGSYPAVGIDNLLHASHSAISDALNRVTCN